MRNSMIEEAAIAALRAQEDVYTIQNRLADATARLAQAQDDLLKVTRDELERRLNEGE